MSLFGKKEKEEIELLNKRIFELESMLTPEMREIDATQERIKQLHAEESSILNEIQTEQNILQKLAESADVLQKSIDSLNKEMVIAEEDLEFEQFALYKPRFKFRTVEQYKNKLNSIRDQEKALIKADAAVSGNTSWTVNNSIVQGRKMVNDTKKLLLRAFNLECDSAIDSVRFNNYDRCVSRIRKSADAINKLGHIMSIKISEHYVKLKIDELTIALEYEQAKQAEKERIRELKAQEREEAKLRKEIEAARKKIEKEQKHYAQALKDAMKQLSNTDNDQEKTALLEKIKDLESHVEDLKLEMESVDYREANQKAGYVYVISNIGSFGENVYKIGMTRRLDPQDRVDELGDASVPFKFDVHAMIFTDDAPKLESALHRAFENKKINMVNPRREFFHVSLDEIKDVVKKNFDKTVEFIDIPEADQYRESVRILESFENSQ